MANVGHWRCNPLVKRFFATERQEAVRIRQNGTGKYTVRSAERESVANRQALFLGMVV
jgi:hypothetical protein